MKFDNLVSKVLAENTNPKLILIRGVSGSGKTTYAKRLMKDDPSLSHYEADMYFYNNGDYQFNPSKLKEAHAWCKSRTEEDLKNGKSVIVSNTFTQKWEIEPYIQLGKKYNVDIIIKKATGNYQNIHGVPEEALEKMRSRWEDVEGEESF
jgi:predicted kinase